MECTCESPPPPPCPSLTAHGMGLVGLNPNVGQLFIVDADKESGCTWELGIRVTPAIVFYRDGNPMNVRRLAQSDDMKLMGSFSAEDVVASVQKARRAVDAGETDIVFDF